MKERMMTASSSTKKYLEDAIYVGLIVVWVVYNLSVLLRTGFISDDSYNVQVKGLVMQQGVSIFEIIWREVQGWILGAGRFLVLGWYMTYGLYYLTQDLLLVKSLNIALVCLDIVLFYFLVKRESGSSSIAFLTGLLIPLFFQIRLWHDPLLAFTFLMPVCWALFLISALTLQSYLDTKKRYFLVVSVVAILMGLLLYELSFALIALLCGLVFARTGKFWLSVRITLPYTLLAGALVLASIVIRLWFSSDGVRQAVYVGAVPHLELDKLLPAVGIQLFSGVPLSYFFNIKDKLDTSLLLKDWIVLGGFGLLLGATLFRVSRMGPSITWKGQRSAVLFSILAFVLPAIVSAGSGHQDELNRAGPGFGYITVYVQYFGLACLTATGLYAVFTRLKKAAFVVLVLVVVSGCVLVAGLNLGLNRAAALSTNGTYLHPRQLVGAALKSGLLENVPAGATIIRSMRVPSDYYLRYNIDAGKIFSFVEFSDTAAVTAAVGQVSSPLAHEPGFLVPGGKGIYMLYYNVDSKDGRVGRVVLAKISKFRLSAKGDKVEQALTESVLVYDLASNTMNVQTNKSRSIDFLKMISTQASDAVGLPGLDLDEYSPDLVSTNWTGKIGALEGGPSSNLRWASGDSELRLFNSNKAPMNVVVTFGLATLAAKDGTWVRLDLLGRQEVIATTPVPFTVERRLRLLPGENIIKFSSNAPIYENGDPRRIIYGIYNFRLLPDDGAKK